MKLICLLPLWLLTKVLCAKGSIYVAIAGEQTSQVLFHWFCKLCQISAIVLHPSYGFLLMWNEKVEIWDLRNNQRSVQLPPDNLGACQGISTKERGILMSVFFLFLLGDSYMLVLCYCVTASWICLLTKFIWIMNSLK